MDGVKLVSFSSAGISYGIPVDMVSEMVPLKELQPMPSKGKEVRGGIFIRDEFIPVIDFRLLMGKDSLLHERMALVDTLTQREQEHIAWVDDLISCIKSGQVFRRATDPKKCAFGKWFYGFKADDVVIDRLFKRFEEPHNTIHALAHDALQFVSNHEKDKALKFVEDAKNSTLTNLLGLFQEFKSALVQDLREIAIIVNTSKDHHVGIAVENIQQILDLEALEHAPKELGGHSDLISSVLKIPQGALYCLDTPTFQDVARKLS